ncbi:MAG: MipA/OmpV family protein [Rhodobacter sp.]|nr:MipA/OmpV family protein [Rhodobacter sp.]
MIRCLAAAALAALPHVAHADGPTFGLGAAVVPQFEGSSDYKVFPAPSFAFSLGPFAVRSNGPGAEADLVVSRSIDAGPIMRWNDGRDPADIDNAAVSALPAVDGALMLGGFAQLNYPLADGTILSPRLNVLQGLDGGHEGLIAEASVGVTRRAADWTYGARAGLTFADDDYMDTFFSVGPASPSGLAAFSAGSGIKDVGVMLFANYQITDNWSATAVAGYRRLTGDAADSPIVSVAGNENQGFLSLGFSYTFN